MRAVIIGYFGTLADPGAEEYREPLAHRAGELLGGCRSRPRVGRPPRTARIKLLREHPRS